MKNIKKLFICMFFALFLQNNSGFSSINSPVAIDSRIKTLIYTPNEIFQLKFIVGYQSIIELEEEETPKIITFGDPIPWAIKQFDNKIIIKALDPGVKTNLTILTNKRTYLMEISSSSIDDTAMDEQLVYVVRFFYPEVDVDVPQSFKVKSPQLNKALTAPNGNVLDRGRSDDINFSYTFAGTGPTILPIKVFDNRRQTFFQFANNNNIIPSVYAVNPDGTESRLRVKLVDDYVVVDAVEYQFSLRWNKELICLFNENLLNPDDQAESVSTKIK